MSTDKDSTQKASTSAKNQCILCERPNSADNLVQCDRCDSYVHFSCAGVNDSISSPDRSFVCQKCTERDEIVSLVSKRSSKNSRSSRKSAQLQLNLKMLEEESRLRMKKIDEEERFRKMRLEAEEEIMKKKFELLQAGFSSDDDQASEKSGVSSRDVRRSTESWVNNVGRTKGACSNVATSASNHQSRANNEEFITNEHSSVQQPITSNTSSNHPESSATSTPKNDPMVTTLSTCVVSTSETSFPAVSLEQSSKQLPSVTFIGHENATESFPRIKQSSANYPSFINVKSTAVAPVSLQPMATDRSLTAVHHIDSLSAGSIINTTSTSTIPLFGGLIRPPERSEYGPMHIQNSVQPTIHANQSIIHNAFASASNSSRMETGCRNQMIDTYSTTPPFRSIQSTSYAPIPSASASYPTVFSSVPANTQRMSHVHNRGMPRNVAPVTMPVDHTETYPPVMPNYGYDETVDRSSSMIPSMSISHGSGLTNQALSGPSAVQIAARQVIPRELPIFSGNPQDWPLFHSAFQNSTTVCGYSDAENLARLQRCLRGHALEAVRSQLLIPDSVPHVMATLARMYGRPEVIINALLKQLRSVPSPKADDLKTLIRFGMAVQNLIGHMIVANQQQHLSNPMLLHELVERLPPNFKLEWANYKRIRLDANLSTFSEFMADLVTMASDVTMHVDPTCGNDSKQEKSKSEKRHKEKLFVHNTSSSSNPDNKRQASSFITTDFTPVRTCCCCGHAGHRIADCEDFKRLDIDGRWKVVRDKNLCRICLVPHKSWPCRSKRECEHENCRLRHNTLLHLSSSTINQATPTSNSVQQNHHFVKAYSLLRYIPITLYGNGKTINVFALLDDGSSSTILEAEVAELLGVSGPEEPLHIYWTSDISRAEQKSQRIQLMVSGFGMIQQYPLRDVKTVSQLKLPSQSMDYLNLCSVHPQLKGLPIKNYSNAMPRIIIGVDNVKLINALKIREGTQGDLTAVKTRLGWTIYGRHRESADIEHLYIHVEQKNAAVDNAALHDLFKQFFTLEEACITVKPETEENKRALQILHRTTSRVATGFEVGLLWKQDERTVPDSFPLALRRLICLEKRLLRDENLYGKVRELIQLYIQKGYAHRATDYELQSVDPKQTWYLPLGVVQNPKKPNKIRLIWDAAATVQGLSFNDLLLKGPDLMVSLVGVLIRFRERNIAIGGDLREMFHQIAIRSADKQYLRFLWRDQPEQRPVVYIMDVAIFGASCSPCMAQFIKNKNATEFSAEFPRATEAIIDNHYVDDYLDSVDTEQEAIDLMKQVQYIHSNGGFELRQFVSNSPEVLRNLGVLQESEKKNLNLDLESERVLGMYWSPTLDNFTFACNTDLLKTSDQHQVPTKRQVLRIIMSVFDPLGLIAHFTIHGKILMQHIWRAGTSWDDLIPEHLQESWDTWRSCLQHLNNVQISRCLQGSTRTDKHRLSELHAFVDASQQAYACAIYLRTTGDSGIACSLIIAKTKVAPLKPVSIPRLELQAALIGARLMDHVCRNLTLPITRRVFWSDSSTVLSWLQADSFRFHQYVAFRVGEILSLSKVDEWQYVPSKLNVIDDATKWKGNPDFKSEGPWYSGPKFLYYPESTWPVQARRHETDEEKIRHMFTHHEETTNIIIDVSRFSNWNRLLRTAAYVRRAVNIWKKLSEDDLRSWISSQEFAEAETLIWRQVQREAFPEEYRLLKTSENRSNLAVVNKSSSLYKLSPFLDPSGVIRMGGRIGAAPLVPYEAKYPIILPKKHAVTFLLTDSYHRRLLHANNETVVNDMRQRYYIPALRRIVKKVGAGCQQCKILKAVPQVPQMASLPRSRLTAFVKPFAYQVWETLTQFLCFPHSLPRTVGSEKAVSLTKPNVSISSAHSASSASAKRNKKRQLIESLSILKTEGNRMHTE